MPEPKKKPQKAKPEVKPPEIAPDRKARGFVNNFVSGSESQRGKRPSNSIANRLRAFFQSRIGIVHFFSMWSRAR